MHEVACPQKPLGIMDKVRNYETRMRGTQKLRTKNEKIGGNYGENWISKTRQVATKHRTK